VRDKGGFAPVTERVGPTNGASAANAGFPAVNRPFSAANPSGEFAVHGLDSEVSVFAAEFGAEGATPPRITPRQNPMSGEKWLAYAECPRSTAE
jgi:hypothetical protein